MNVSRHWWWLGALVPMGALATTMVSHTLAQRAQASDRVALVQVLSRRVEGEPTHLKTLTEVSVGTDVRGRGPSYLTIVQIGGSMNGYQMHIPGDASFEVGEVCLVFLRCDDARCALVAMGEGKVPISQGQAVVHDLFTGRFIRRSLTELIAQLRAVPVVPPVGGVGTQTDLSSQQGTP